MILKQPLQHRMSLTQAGTEHKLPGAQERKDKLLKIYFLILLKDKLKRATAVNI